MAYFPIFVRIDAMLGNSGNYRTLHKKDGLNPIELLFSRFLEFPIWV